MARSGKRFAVRRRVLVFPGRATAVFQPPFGVDLDLRALDRVAREPGALPLRLFAFHADGAGGLEPLLSVHRTFIVLSFAIGADLGGALANRMVHLNEPYTIYRTLLVLVVIALTLVLLAPLTLLSRLLIPARYDAAEQFGAMTFELSRMMEKDAERGARSGLTEEMLTLIRSFSDSYGGHKIITGTSFVPVTRSYALSFALAPPVPLLLALLTRSPCSSSSTSSSDAPLGRDASQNRHTPQALSSTRLSPFSCPRLYRA